MTERAADVVARYMPLIRKTARRLVPPQEVDDAVQDGMVGVWRAARRWQPGGTSFEWWIQQSVGRAIIDGQRVRTGYKRYGRVDVLRFDGFDPQANTYDDPEQRAVTADQVRWVRTKLSPADVALFDGLLEGRTQQSIADEQGVTLSRVCQRVAKIRQLLNN